MTKELKNKLDQMVNKIESMPHNTLQEIEDKDSAAHLALKFLIRTLQDLQVDGIHYQTLESIMEEMDDKIERFESIS
jgi:flagellar motor component MotA